MRSQQARRAGGEVLLAAPAGAVARMLDLTGLGELLGVHASVAAAVASAAQPAAAGAWRRHATREEMLVSPHAAG